MDTQRFHELMEKYLEERIQPAEQQELATLLQDPVYSAELDKKVLDFMKQDEEGFELNPVTKDAIRQFLHAQMAPPVADKPVSRLYSMKKWGWVAAAVIVLTAGCFWLSQYMGNGTGQEQTAKNITDQTDVLPGGEKAMLTLADGTKILLDSAGNGLLARQGETGIEKLADGEIRYNLKGVSGGEPMMNTMSTPKGGQYRLTLPDGTKLWLNAATTIKYFASNTGSSRTVEVNGEAYFEVAKDAKRPFIVKKGAANITVLGTHFNVNGYDDESELKVTLLQGSVKVEDVLLKPGEQVEVKNTTGTAIPKVSAPVQVQTDAVIAWKNGWFSFRNADVETLMRQLSRWYDIEVDYDGKIPMKTFTGDITRSLTLNQVLKGITKTTGLKYKYINEKKIMIQP